MWTWLLGGLLKLVPGLYGMTLKHLEVKAQTEAQGFKTAAGFDSVNWQAYLRAQVDNNAIKVSANQWWGAKVIIMMAGGTAAFHMALIFIDSTCPASGVSLFGWQIIAASKVGGCGWGIPKIPDPYSMYEWVLVNSFFITLPAQGAVSALDKWLNRRH
jgi:hypothetical protein